MFVYRISNHLCCVRLNVLIDIANSILKLTMLLIICFTLKETVWNFENMFVNKYTIFVILFTLSKELYKRYLKNSIGLRGQQNINK